MKKIFEPVEKIIILCLFLLVYIAGVSSIPFHADESQWISTSSVFEEFFSGRFRSPEFQDSYWTRIQPPIVRYVIGFGRRMGGFRPPDLNAPWDFLDDAQQNIEHHAMPSESLLWWSRSIMAVLAAASMFSTYWFIQNSFNRIASYGWVFLCLINSFFLETFCRAMGESVLLAGVIFSWGTGWLALLALNERDEKKRNGRVVLWMAAMGFWVGITTGAKFNGASLLGASFLIAFVLAIKLQSTFWGRTGMFLWLSAVSSLAAWISFIGLNPYLWSFTFRKLQWMYQVRIEEMDVVLTGNATHTMVNWQDRLPLIPQRIFGDLTSLRHPAFFYLNIIFFLIGLIHVALRAYHWWKDQDESLMPVSLLFVAAAASLPSVLSKLDWGRYFALPVFFSLVFISIGLSAFGSWIYQYFKMHKKAAPDSPG